MTKPIVAIVGRPNVGKSTFFNKVVGRRMSIVQNMPGVTRDRVYYDTEWCGYAFTLVDTGGLELNSEDTMWRHIKAQAEMAIDLAEVIVFFTDGKQGLVSDDYDVAKLLRASKKPIVLAVNKLDNNEIDTLYDFYQLGLGEPISISAEQGKGIGDLLDEIIANLKNKIDADAVPEAINIAVIGRPNAGKSSIVNKLLGYDRVIVSDIAGTTRDAIDTPFTFNDRNYNLIDTAGMRRKRSVDEDVEYYSNLRSMAAIKRADVVLMIIDSSEDISEQDIRICGYVHEEGKPSVIVMNKWDLVAKDTNTMNQFIKILDEKLKYMSYYVPMFVSALSGQRVEKLMERVEEVYGHASFHASTGVLNDVVQEAIAVNEPPSDCGKRLKIYYATQATSNPPTFIFFVNDSNLMHFSYKRYLENTLRKSFDFGGTPIRLIIRNKNDNDV